MRFPFWKRKDSGAIGEGADEEQRCLVVGLGNPGRQYAGNRHNIGFMAVDEIAGKHNITMGRAKFGAVYGEGRLAGVSVVLAKPQTYMNKSGLAVGQLARFFKVPTDRVLVVYDELDLPLGALRLRRSGGSGGHNGMKSVIQHIGDEFPRLRLGIGRPPGQMPPAAFVLQNFGKSEQGIVEVMLAEAAAAVETFAAMGIEKAMALHNGLVSSDD